jgi:hypothetical protein
MTLRLTEEEAAALRERAELDKTSMQEVARAAIREYTTRRKRDEKVRRVIDTQVPRYADALRRLGE